MASFEKVTTLTGRFDVVDAEENQISVMEYTTYLVRRSSGKTYRPMLNGVTYRVENGIAVRPTCDGHFENEDGSKRFIVIRSHDVPAVVPKRVPCAPGGMH